MSNFEKYDLHNNTQENSRKSCNINSKDQLFLGASSIFQKIKSNLSNLIFIGKEDGIENTSIQIYKNSFHKFYLDVPQSNEVNKIYDAPTLELNMSQEFENPIHINTNPNLEFTNKKLNETGVRKFSLDSSRTNQTKKKSNPITRIVHYITEKKFNGKEKTDLKNLSFISKNSAFKPIDKKNKIIDLNSKKIINYNDFFEVMKDKNLIKPVPIRRSPSQISQIAKKRNRTLDNSLSLKEEEKIKENGVKRRKIISDDDRSLFSSVQNLNKIRNLQRDDVSMKSINSVMSYKFMKEDKERDNLEKNANDDVSMNILIPENKSVVKSFYSKTLDEIKSEIEEKRGKNLRMLDEISRRSRKSKDEKKIDYDEKKKFLSNYYKEKEKNFKEMDLLSKGGKISLNESDLNRDKNLSYSKSSMMIESAPKKNKNVDIVKSSNFDICSNKSEKLVEEKEEPKELIHKTNENLSQNLIFGQDKKITFGDSNALTDKKTPQFGEKIEVKDKSPFITKDSKSSAFFSTFPSTNKSENVFGLGESKKTIKEEEKSKDLPSNSFQTKETEKKEEKLGIFGIGLAAHKDVKSGLFGNAEKKDEGVRPFGLFGEKKEEKTGELFDKFNKKEEKTALFNTIFNKKEESNFGESKESVSNIDKKEENPISFFGQQEKKEVKPIFSFGLKSQEEQKSLSLAHASSNFSLLNPESDLEKPEQEQKSSSLFPSLNPKTNPEDKSKLKEREQLKPSEETPVLFGNKEAQPSSSFTSTTMNKNTASNLPLNQTLFGSFKDLKEEKSTITSGSSNENKPTLFNLDNKDKESTSPTTTSKLLGNLKGTNQQSFSNEPQKSTTTETSSTFLNKDQSATSLVNDANPFLKSYGTEQKAPTIFQSPNTKPGMNYFNSSIADGMVNNSIGTPAFFSGIGMSKIASSSINSSNRSGDIFENLDKNPGNKSFPMTSFSSSHNLASSSNPFIPKGNIGPKADIFSDHNESMAISPITSPKMLSKNNDINTPNIFQSSGTSGINNTITTGLGLFGNNTSSSQPTTSTVNSNNPFLIAGNTNNINNIFSKPNPTQNVSFGAGSELFPPFFSGNSMNQQNVPGLFSSTGNGPSFSLGKKK